MIIRIYEDNSTEYESLYHNIVCFFQKKHSSYTIFRVNDTEELFHHIYDTDMIFLDIELKNENGIDIGINLRALNKKIIIIFVTNFTQYLIDGYKAHANRYFLKPIVQNQFDIEMCAVLEDYLQNSSGFIDTKLSPSYIYYKDILYIEFIHKSRSTILHMIDDSQIIAKYPLKYWIDKLQDYPFHQTYKSIILNLNSVSGFYKNDVILINEEYIPLSRKYKKAFHEAYLTHLHKKM